MPDLISHSAAAYLLSRPARFDGYKIPFFIGTILPDIISRPFYILFPKWYPYTIAMHTPLFLVVASIFISQFFAQSIRKGVFASISLGVFLHLFLDLFQKHIHSGYLWAFPFSWATFEIGLYWPETPLSWAPAWIGLLIIVEYFYRKKINH